MSDATIGPPPLLPSDVRTAPYRNDRCTCWLAASNGEPRCQRPEGRWTSSPLLCFKYDPLELDPPLPLRRRPGTLSRPPRPVRFATLPSLIHIRACTHTPTHVHTPFALFISIAALLQIPVHMRVVCHPQDHADHILSQPSRAFITARLMTGCCRAPRPLLLQFVSSPLLLCSGGGVGPRKASAAVHDHHPANADRGSG